MAVASHSIMSHAPAERAGMAASVEEVAFELGGAIGITILGTVLAGVYAASLVVPKGPALPPAVDDGIDQALAVAATLPGDAGRQLTAAIFSAFDRGYAAALALASILLLAIAIKAWVSRQRG
jgi:DHA2 family multidrug resistance protein-like MFS transporter